MSGWERRQRVQPSVPNSVPCQHEEGDGAQGLTLGTGSTTNSGRTELHGGTYGFDTKDILQGATQQEAWEDSSSC